MEFTKEKTNITKGLAICLMFANHLYAFPHRLLHGNYYIPVIPFFDVEFYIGGFGQICVSMFIFLSGYGMFLGYSRSNKSAIYYSLIKIKEFYITYWSYFLVFISIGLIFFRDVTLWNSQEIRYSTEALTFAENFVGWSARYNGEWWFVRMFVFILILLCPIFIALANKNIFLLCLISISLFLLSLILRIDYTDPFGFIFWQVSFAVGILCAKLKFFSSRLVQYLDNYGVFWVFLGIFLVFIVRFRFGARADFLFISFFIYLAVRAIAIVRLSKLFIYVGQYSFPLWLVHSFFCYYYFQDIVYFPKWSLLIFALLTSMSLLSVITIEYLRSHFHKLTTAVK